MRRNWRDCWETLDKRTGVLPRSPVRLVIVLPGDALQDPAQIIELKERLAAAEDNCDLTAELYGAWKAETA